MYDREFNRDIIILLIAGLATVGVGTAFQIEGVALVGLGAVIIAGVLLLMQFFSLVFSSSVGGKKTQ